MRVSTEPALCNPGVIHTWPQAGPSEPAERTLVDNPPCKPCPWNERYVLGAAGMLPGRGIQTVPGARTCADGPPRKGFPVPERYGEHFRSVPPLTKRIQALFQGLWEDAPVGFPECPVAHHTSLPFCSVLRWVYTFRTDSPLSSMRCAPCTIRSQMASAMVGSPIISCQPDTGSCETKIEDARP